MLRVTTLYASSASATAAYCTRYLAAPGAARARALRTDPRMSKTAFVLEAKFYSKTVRLRTGREFLGLGVDLGVPSTFFVSSAPSESVHRMLSHRQRRGHFDVVPGVAQEGEFPRESRDPASRLPGTRLASNRNRGRSGRPDAPARHASRNAGWAPHNVACIVGRGGVG